MVAVIVVVELVVIFVRDDGIMTGGNGGLLARLAGPAAPTPETRNRVVRSR